MNDNQTITERSEKSFPIFCKNSLGRYCIISKEEVFEVIEHVTEQAISHTKAMRGNNLKYNSFLVGEMILITDEEFVTALKNKTSEISKLYAAKFKEPSIAQSAS